MSPPERNRGEFSTCTTPTDLDSRDPYDLQQLGGARMLYNTQDMLFRRKLEEQAELQQAIDLQSRRLMSLQLLDFKKHHHHRNLSTGAFSVPSPTHSHAFLNQTLINSMKEGSLLVMELLKCRAGWWRQGRRPMAGIEFPFKRRENQ